MTNPRLRYLIDLSVIQEQGEYVVTLRCREGLSPAPMALKGVTLNVIQYLNGAYAEESIEEMVKSKTGIEGLTQEVLKILDEGLFLENEKSTSERKKQQDYFFQNPIRESQFAGGIYPHDAAERKSYIKQLIDMSHCITTTDKTPCFIITPHIDYRRGDITYGRTFKSSGALSWDSIILIGTNHQPSSELFSITKKDFSLPGFTFQTDAQGVELIASKTGSWIFNDEYCHRAEHSLELQLPFLENMSPQSKLIPVLVGGFHQFLETGALPSSSEKYNAFIDALVSYINDKTSEGKSVGVLAGVDMAHIGKTFGDTQQLDDTWLERVQSQDLEYLSCLERMDKASLFAHMASDKDARRMCGFPSLYTMLDMFDRLGKRISVQTIDYRQAVNYETQTCVTFSGGLGYQI